MRNRTTSFDLTNSLSNNEEITKKTTTTKTFTKTNHINTSNNRIKEQKSPLKNQTSIDARNKSNKKNHKEYLYSNNMLNSNVSINDKSNKYSPKKRNQVFKENVLKIHNIKKTDSRD